MSVVIGKDQDVSFCFISSYGTRAFGQLGVVAATGGNGVVTRYVAAHPDGILHTPDFGTKFVARPGGGAAPADAVGCDSQTYPVIPKTALYKVEYYIAVHAQGTAVAGVLTPGFAWLTWNMAGFPGDYQAGGGLPPLNFANLVAAENQLQTFAPSPNINNLHGRAVLGGSYVGYFGPNDTFVPWVSWSEAGQQQGLQASDYTWSLKIEKMMEA